MDSFVTVFPHTTLSQTNLKRGLLLFDRLSICRPWFLEVNDREETSGLVETLLPPADFKPPENFNRLLSEYLVWIKEHEGEGLSLFLGSRGIASSAENARWEIGRNIRTMGGSSPPPHVDPALRWHMILHLAASLEKNRSEVAEMLSGLKEVKTPLAEAIGETEEPSQGLFDDLPLDGPAPSAAEERLGAILEAWFGLFGSLQGDFSRLMTFDPAVMSIVREHFEEEGRQNSGHALRLALPDVSSLPWEDFLQVRGKHAGHATAALRDWIEGSGDSDRAAEGIESGLENLAKALATGPERRDLLIEKFNPIHPADGSALAPVLSGIRGKTLILLEEKRRHG